MKPALAVSLAGALAFLVGAAAGWPGAPNGCLAADSCFCETAVPGPVKQAANTASALAFTAAGLWIGRRAAGRRWKAYAALVAGVGVGTAFFHGSLTWWGGTLDYLSMYLLLSFCTAHSLVRGWRLRETYFLPLFLAAFVPAAAVNLADLLDTPPIFACVVAAAVFSETAAAYRRPDLARVKAWLGATFALFAGAFGVWWMSRTGAPWCVPDSPLQGHAVWHVLTAAATMTLFLYFDSERAEGMS